MRVLVTAGGAGIGQAIVEEFLMQGAQVFTCDIDAAAVKDMQDRFPSLGTKLADVSSQSDVAALCDAATGAMGGIDVLVNNAGIGGPRNLIGAVDSEAWQQCMDVNLSGPFYMMQRVVPAMKKRRSGCIINISTSSARTGLIGRSAYVASKAGLIALSYNTAREVGPWNIRCNAILPGLIDNERGHALIDQFASERCLSREYAKTEFLSFVSMRTMIAPREVAQMCVFLASDGAGHVTGQAISVDGNVEWES